MVVGQPNKDKLLPVPGIQLASTIAGIYKKPRPDLALISCAPGSRVAGVFTRNAFCAAPVHISKKHLNSSSISHLLINAGNANAGTGSQGLEDALHSCQKLSGLVNGTSEQILPFSTGVIGEPLPVEKITAALPVLLDSLNESGWEAVAKAIMTTDTVMKGISRQIKLNGTTVTITGIAKGSGMIRPDMATMLAFIATDADISKPLLDSMLREAVENSFNLISVDGDTSTNDACMLIATGKSGAEILQDRNGNISEQFMGALQEVCKYLAQQIVRDGEGATKFVTIKIEQAASRQECLQVATAIAHSPLVKTALFASDPNWGRILAAVGRAGLEKLDISRVNIRIGDIYIVTDGYRSPDYTEEQGRKLFSRPEILLTVTLGRGQHQIEFWTCDLSYDYVKINAEYRT